MTTLLRHRLNLLLALASFTACNHGTRPADLPSATTPAGATVQIRITDESTNRTVELFAVDDSALLVHTDEGRLLRVRWSRLESLEPGRLSSYRFGVTRNEEVQTAKRRRLALVSRFPQGLEGQLLANVLRTLKQDTVDELPPSAPSQDSDRISLGADAPSLEAFAATAMAASSRYADRRVAIADGYRRIGADFPAMGEHWLRTSELLAGRLDPHRPTLLTYAVIKEQPTLVGTGFVVTTRDDEAARQAPGWPSQWHEHSGQLSDESGARPVASVDHSHDADRRRGTRAWVLHIWTTLENPAGRYQADNWALPFARAGLVTHDGVTVDEAAGRALSLAVGGDRFLRDVLTDAGLRATANAQSVDSAIARARSEAERVLSEAREAGRADTMHLTALRSTWSILQTALIETAGPAVTHYLTSVH